MTTAHPVNRSAQIVRWIARIWTVLLTVFVLMMVFTPDPNASGPIAAEDVFFLSLWGAALVGLWLAWRWEGAGAIFTIAIMFFREIAWVILKGGWMIGFLFAWLVFVPPALLFLLARRQEHRV
jgi:hypothetical protein